MGIRYSYYMTGMEKEGIKVMASYGTVCQQAELLETTEQRPSTSSNRWNNDSLTERGGAVIPKQNHPTTMTSV